VNTITQYISEKLHLNRNNKDLVTMEDPADFIESFDNATARKHIIDLLRYCIKAVNQKGYGNKTFNENHKCYIVENVNMGYKNPLNQYAWDENIGDEDYEVDDIQGESYGNTKWKVVFVVTRQTIIPEKYKKEK